MMNSPNYLRIQCLFRSISSLSATITKIPLMTDLKKMEGLFLTQGVRDLSPWPLGSVAYDNVVHRGEKLTVKEAAHPT